MTNNKEMMNKIRDYADCADASYAMLHYVFESVDFIFPSKVWVDSDGIKFGDKTKKGDKFIVSHK